MRRGGSRSHKCAGMGPVSDARCEEFRAVSEILVKVARGQLGLLGLSFVSGRS